MEGHGVLNLICKKRSPFNKNKDEINWSCVWFLCNSLRSGYSTTLIDSEQSVYITVCVLALLHPSENGNGGCVSPCLCVHVQRVFFTSYSQTPCVPAMGLSHSYWPRCHPSLHPRQTFSMTSGPRGLKRGWWYYMEGGGGDLRPKPYLMWKDISIYFQKHFRVCWQTQSDIAATPRLTPNAVAATCSLQILWFTQEVFHIAAWCQQLAGFKV